jgi:phage terminase large subunit-like protein
MIASVYQPPTDVAGYDPLRDSEGYWFDAQEAVRRIRFFEIGLTHTKGHLKGKPFLLEPWEKDLIATLFGWKKDDGTRRYRECFLFVPRKNGKTTLAAGITLCVFYQDGEGAAECYCVAGDLDQTDMVYGTAAAMVRGNKRLDSISKVRDSRKRIVYGDSFFRAIPADDKGAHGFNLHFVCGDEVHTWKGRDLKDTLHTGTGFRMQPLEVYITTAGFDLKSIAGETYTYACNVRDGVINDATFLPVIYEAPKDADWKSEATWKIANPNYGVSLKPDYIAAECKKAIENPAYENTFRRLHLNQWTEQKTRWLKLDDWRSCKLSGKPIEDKAYIVGGLDLSSTTDVTAYCRLQKVGDGWKVEWRFYIPEDRARIIADRDRVPYLEWIRDGYVTATPGRTVDYTFVERDILEDSHKYTLQRLGYDPWNARGLERRLTAEGMELVEIRQGPASLSAACKELERAVISGAVDHGNNPVAEWMVSNVEVVTDSNGNIKPAKPEHNASGKKIDGVSALVTAIAVAMTTEEAPKRTGRVFSA